MPLLNLQERGSGTELPDFYWLMIKRTCRGTFRTLAPARAIRGIAQPHGCFGSAPPQRRQGRTSGTRSGRGQHPEPAPVRSIQDQALPSRQPRPIFAVFFRLAYGGILNASYGQKNPQTVFLRESLLFDTPELNKSNFPITRNFQLTPHVMFFL